MHASIAVCVVLVGGWVAPQRDTKIIPLHDDLFRSVYWQKLQAEFQGWVYKPSGKYAYDPGPTIDIPRLLRAEARKPRVVPLTPTQVGELPGRMFVPPDRLRPCGADVATGMVGEPFFGEVIISVRSSFTYVQPVLQQLQFNQLISEELTPFPVPLYIGNGSGAPTTEIPAGAGLADPRPFNNYHGYYPQNP